MTEAPFEGPLDERGGDMLSRISTEMVRAQKKYFGKGPTSAKSYMLDDFLLIVMRENRTVAERTMVDFGREDLVRTFRQEFENEMTGKLQGMIEELTGRRILGYQSQIIIRPDIVIEIFFFDRSAETAEIDATARGQLEDPSIGEARAGSADDDMTETDIAGG
jgi:uncharacterized protein YbcI